MFSSIFGNIKEHTDKMAKKQQNSNLTLAKNNKKDEFYTQLSDIEKELKHYKNHFKDKVVLCNCDDPRVSNFFHFFSYNFEAFGLKKLIATCYKSQNADLFSENNSERAIYLEYEGDKNGDNIPNPEEIGIKLLKGDGDFRSKECIELLKQADIVVTNPPFSLFREYVAQLIQYDKKFVIVGHQNAITYKEIFKLIKEDKLWLGFGFTGGAGHFINSQYEDYATSGDHKEGMIRVSGVHWFTNLDINKRHEDLILYKQYTPEEFPAYDNYDAINVNVTKDIPIDYPGAMGVPITFLDKYNPDQFEVLGMTSGRDEFDAIPTKRYENPKQINKDGSMTNGSKANTRATLLLSNKPSEIYYTADNANGYLSILYARIIIKHKKL